MRDVSRGALASVCWHCSMQSGGTAVHEGKQCLFPCDVTIKSTSLFIQINSCNLPYTFCEQIGKEIKDISDEIPFEIPESWEWVKHNSLFELSGGSQPPKSMFRSEKLNGYIRLYQIRDYGKNPVPTYIPIETASKISQKGDILLARYGASLGKVFWAEYGAYNVAMAKVIPLFNISTINSEFLFLYYHSSVYRNIIFNNSRCAQAGFNKDDLENLYFPLPPIQEQTRIVDAYKKLLPFIEKYEQAETQLTTLNTSFPEMLKKSILQEAVQGKLVPQSPDDEPASILLERIRAEKQKLIKAGKIKKSKHESVIVTRDKIPYEIPDSWAWCRLSDICQSINDGDHQPPPQEENGKPFIVISNISGDRIDFSNTRYVPEEYYSRLNDNRKPMKNDILFTVTGSYGIVIKVDTDREFCFQRHIALLKPLCVDRDILVHWLTSPLVFEQCKKTATGTAQKTVGITSLKNIIIPLPPLPEQKRIVEKIEELIPMINSMSK